MGSGAISPVHLVILLVVVLLVVGPSKLPELGSTVGRTLRDFREAVGDIKGPIDASVASARVAPPAVQASATEASDLATPGAPPAA